MRTTTGWPVRGAALLAWLLAAAPVLLAGPAAAQPLEAPGREMSVILRAGGYLPANDLASGSLRTDVLPPRVALGVAVENDLGESPLAVRVTLDAVPSYTVSVGLVCPEDEAGSCPGSDRLTYRLGMAAVDLVVRPLRLGRTVPYLQAGVAAKGYLREDPADDRVEPSLHFGSGVEFDLGGHRVSVEVADYLSWFAPVRESPAEIQHDVVVGLGLRLGL